jgi:hypothetical protein
VNLDAASFLQHALDKGVDVLLAVAVLAALDEVVELLLEAAVGGRELEGPEEVVGLLEVRADGEDLVDKILNADDAVLAELSLNDSVVADGNTLLVELGVTALVEELAHGLEVGVAPGNVGPDELEHLEGGLVDADEGGVEDLPQAEELENLLDLGADTVDTTDTDDKGKLVLGRDCN